MLMRFTMIAPDGTISFCGPGHVLKMLAAVVSCGSVTVRDALTELERFDEQVATSVRRDLSIFDEHCLATDRPSIDRWFASEGNPTTSPFRVIDGLTRRISTESARLGLAIFNLRERRIIQVENSYGALLRRDRGRVRRNGKPIGRYYSYELPTEWSILP